MKLHKKLIVRGSMELLTGLRVGDSKDSVDIGGVDLPVVRRKDNNQPYIPGSSLKGKIRSLLEVATGSNAHTDFRSYSQQGLAIANLFGWFGPAGPKNQGNPSRLLVRDAYLTPEWQTRLEDSEFTDMPYTEIKFENTINRLTGVTVDGGIRQVERIPAGAAFNVEFVINIMRDEAEDDAAITERETTYLNLLKAGINLLEHDYLGGSGSRGYGQVSFDFNNWENVKESANQESDKGNFQRGSATSARPATSQPKQPVLGTSLPIVRLHFRAPLHLSDARPNDYGQSQRIVHSDTLMAAICQSWAMLGKTDWIPQPVTDEQGETVGATSPGFVLSSLFPFHGGRIADPKHGIADIAPIYFVPKPYFLNEAESRANNPAPGEAKKYKKIQYVDTDFLGNYLLQTAPTDSSTAAIRGAFRSRALAGLSNEQAEFMVGDVVPRIVKPRDETEPTPYYMERLYFRYNSGLWAVVHYDGSIDPAVAKHRLGAALNYLADEGIGTDRTVGNGVFAWQEGSIRLPLPTQGGYAMNLSLFCPPDAGQLQVMFDPNARYDFLQRGGWISEPYNTYRKRSVWMFREGSLMRLPDRQPTVLGNTVNLQPDILGEQHPVWRDGRALWLPVNLPTP